MDVLDGIPRKILGHQIKTRTQIVLTFLIPAIFELLVYTIVTTADILVTVQHFKNGNRNWAYMTGTFICLPSVICSCAIFSSLSQWPAQAGCKETLIFCTKHLFNLVLFPLGAVYRFSRRIFWCVESLFYAKSSRERCHAVTKAVETSPFELYHFIQAFTQAAPQIILQLYIMLRENTFRDYETTTAQVVSVIFSLIVMATIIMSYQRFESQKIVGKHYPWSTMDQIQTRSGLLKRTTSTPNEYLMATRDIRETSFVSNIMHNFHTRYSEPEKQNEFKFDPNVTNSTDDDKIESIHDTASPSSSFRNDLIENIDEIKDFIQRTDGDLPSDSDDEVTDTFDHVPTTPAPPTPLKLMQDFGSRLSTFKDMLIFNAETIIKEHVPRLPEGVFDHDQKQADEFDDIPLPSRVKMFIGVEQDDLLGKSVSFTGWIMFLFMRMISLSVFSVFYPSECAYLCLSHYLIMLSCIFYETKFHEKLERIFFYIFLAYIYVYSLLEFKIKFIHVRRWYVPYFVFVLLQNVVITNVWYHSGTFHSWWFPFLYFSIHACGVLSVICLLFYYSYLKPPTKVLYANS